MVSIYDMAKADADGNITEGEILLPEGKIPFVLSQDDVCYYHYMDGDGYASKLVLRDLGIPFYDPYLIIQKTEGRMAEDDFWIRIEK